VLAGCAQPSRRTLAACALLARAFAVGRGWSS
jgi:hypothetical protein